MENLLGQIYCWFQSLYGQDLSYYLWGYDPATEAYTNPNLYNLVGLITLAISLVIVVVFYYLTNSPDYNKHRWWSWLLRLGVNSVIALFVGFGITVSKLINGFIPESLVYQLDGVDNVRLIGQTNCWGFGIANFFVAAMFFVILSFLLKWWSSSAKYVPF